MSKTPTQATPSSDATSDASKDEEFTGRTGGGESGGGAFKDRGQVPTKPGSFKGGQSQKDYHGSADAAGGGADENAVTKAD